MTKDALDPPIREVLDRLYAAYDRPSYDGPDDLLGTLVRTIISQQTTSSNASRAFGELVDRYAGDWARIHAAPRDEIEDAISVAGLSGQKAQRIQTLLERLDDERGEYSLAFLRDCRVDEARSYLTDFKGVGPKTAAFTLMYAADMPVFPMDTHIIRICQRLEWLPESTSNQRAHDIIEPNIPAGEHFAAHMVLVRHGRRTCHARSPKCSTCALLDLCPTGQANARG
ncbi:MAG: endonuclease III domain-containing protein [Myxococcota bacterium]